jgi:hypothetical protein
MTVLFALIATVSVCISVIVCVAYRNIKLTIKHNLDYFNHLNDRLPTGEPELIDLKKEFPKLYRGV